MGSGPGGGDEIVGLVGFWDLIVRVDLNRDLVGPLVDGKDITGKSVTPAIGVIDDTLVGEGTSGLGLAVDDFFNGEVGGGGRAVFDKVLDVEADLDPVAVIGFEGISVGELGCRGGAIPVSIPKGDD